MNTRPFDPFAATLDEAMADADPLAVTHWAAAQQLLADRERFEANPLAGVYLCAAHALLIPEWLADAYKRCYAKVMNYTAKTLDEAFGAPLPKNKHRARLRFAQRHSSAIFRDVLDAVRRDPTRALDADLFEEIGRRHGAGKTLAYRLYRDAVQRFGYDASGLKAHLTARTKSQPAKKRKLAGLQRKR